MKIRPIILVAGPWLFIAGASVGQQLPPAPTYNAPASPPVGGSPAYVPQPAVVVPTPPIYPPGSTVVPLPSQTPGSIFGPPPVAPSPAGAVPVVPSGAEPLPLPPGAPVVVGPPGGPLPPEGAVPGMAPSAPNPITVPVVDDDLAWDQIADVVSDYFTISREQRARRGPESLAEGCIETAPLDGATVLEPHRKDSVGWFNRWESTFQSIRRRATVRVVPDANGYLVEVIVLKELEDLAKPEKATAGAAVFRTDGSLPSSRLEEVSRTRQSPCWILLGRDVALEQRMLAEIHARLNGVTSNRVSVFR